MKKGKFVDIYVIMACLSHNKKNQSNLDHPDSLLQNVPSCCKTEECIPDRMELELVSDMMY